MDKRTAATWRATPGPARQLGTAIGRAVRAARDQDAGEYQESVTALAGLGPEATGGLLGAVLRAQLEDQHPDGLDRDDIQVVLRRCYRSAAAWWPVERIQVPVLIAALASALGIHEPGVTYHAAYPAATDPDKTGRDRTDRDGTDPDQTAAEPSRVPTAAEYTGHAPLLIADLLAAGGRSLDGYLDAAFAEIGRAETMEQP